MTAQRHSRAAHRLGPATGLALRLVSRVSVARTQARNTSAVYHLYRGQTAEAAPFHLPTESLQCGNFWRSRTTPFRERSPTRAPPPRVTRDNRVTNPRGLSLSGGPGRRG